MSSRRDWLLALASTAILLLGCANADENLDAQLAIDPSLLQLHIEYTHHLDAGGSDDDFESSNQALRIKGGRVFLDAVAVDDAAALAKELEQIGAEVHDVVGLYVSCKLPIARIPTLGQIKNLRSARPVTSTTNS